MSDADILAMVEGLRLEHDHYCYLRTGEGARASRNSYRHADGLPPTDGCDCGAEKHNARVDALLAALGKRGRELARCTTIISADGLDLRLHLPASFPIHGYSGQRVVVVVEEEGT